MSEGQLEAKIILEDNNLYKIKYYFTDNHGIDHSVIIFEGEEYIIRYKKKDFDNIKAHIVEYMRKYRKKDGVNMPFKMWLKTFKGFYW